MLIGKILHFTDILAFKAWNRDLLLAGANRQRDRLLAGIDRRAGIDALFNDFPRCNGIGIFFGLLNDKAFIAQLISRVGIAVANVISHLPCLNAAADNQIDRLASMGVALAASNFDDMIFSHGLTAFFGNVA